MVDPRPALVAAYRRITADTRARTLRHANGLWIQMGDWSDASADTMVSRLVPVVVGAERATAAATAAFLTQYQGIPAREAPPLDLAAVTGGALRGVDPQTVYLRSVIETRATYARLRDAGLTLDEIIDTASQAGLRRLLGTVGTDLQLAATHTADQQLSAAGISTYRRVTRAGACGLCIKASDRVYSVGDLLPIHTNCHCIVVPGEVLPTGLRRASNGDQPADGRGLRISENAEIGPVMDWDTAATTGSRRTRKRPTKATTDEQRRAMQQAQLDGYEKVLAEGRGTPWMEQKVTELRAELGGGAGGLPPRSGGSPVPTPPGPEFGKRVELDIDQEIVRSRSATDVPTMESALAQAIPEDFATAHERSVASWLNDLGIRVLRVRNVPERKTPDAVIPDGPWRGTVDFKQVKGLNGIRTNIDEGSLQSSRVIIDVLNGPFTEEQLMTMMRLGIWQAPRPVTEVIVRHHGLVLHWVLPS